MPAPYPSPLAGTPWEGQPALPTQVSADGKSLVNPGARDGVLSPAYKEFQAPISNSNNGFDVHIYHFQNSPDQVQHAKDLYERIRHEFPELRIYKFWDKPVGPHPVAMFEVNLFTPAQFGAFVPFLVGKRGPLSVLIHPNTNDPIGDHTERATWMGERIPLDIEMLRRFEAQRLQVNTK